MCCNELSDLHIIPELKPSRFCEYVNSYTSLVITHAAVLGWLVQYREGLDDSDQNRICDNCVLFSFKTACIDLLIVQCVCVGQMISCRSLFSPSTVQVPGAQTQVVRLGSRCQAGPFCSLRTSQLARDASHWESFRLQCHSTQQRDKAPY